MLPATDRADWVPERQEVARGGLVYGLGAKSF